MKRLLPFRLYLVAAVAALLPVNCLSSEVFYVSEVIRIVSPVCFECKIKNYPAAPGVRFQVFLKNADTQSFDLKEVLKNAKNIELRNVNMRNYFRMEAEVWADGKSLNERYNENANPILEHPSPLKNQTYAQRDLPIQSEQKNPNTIEKGSDSRVSVLAILNTAVDLSSLTSETSFYEAIEIIRDSLDYRLPILVLWSDIETNSLVYKDTPIGVDGFRIISLEKALEIILHSISGSGERLRFAAEGGILKIGTETSVLKRTAKVYSITDLLLPPAHDTSENGYNKY